MAKCERCKSDFECTRYDIEQCQCNAVKLTAAQLALIKKKYKGCLCANCLLLLQANHQTNA